MRRLGQVQSMTRHFSPETIGGQTAMAGKRRTMAGFSLIELLVVIAIAGVLTAIAVPMTINAMRTYRLTSAVAAATGAISAARYAEVMRGYPGTGTPGYGYEVKFTPPNTYQIFTMPPPATTFLPEVMNGTQVNPTTPIPIDGSGQIVISRTVTYQFSAGGTVTETSNPPNMSFQIAIINPSTGQPYNAVGWSNTITVSGVGNVSVTSP
jgi:prepilin-type N-terminal cleavage/methylation domain-containing protein